MRPIEFFQWHLKFLQAVTLQTSSWDVSGSRSRRYPNVGVTDSFTIP